MNRKNTTTIFHIFNNEVVFKSIKSDELLPTYVLLNLYIPYCKWKNFENKITWIEIFWKIKFLYEKYGHIFFKNFLKIVDNVVPELTRFHFVVKVFIFNISKDNKN